MTAITKAELYSAPYNVIFSIINTRANIADPRDAGGTRKFVYDAEPFVKAADFSNYPLIILKMPVLDQTQASANQKYKRLAYVQTILVRTVKKGSGGSRADSGRSDMQSIVDSLLNTFNSTTIKETLQANLIFHAKLDIVDMDDIAVESQQAVYETELELMYNTRVQVST